MPFRRGRRDRGGRAGRAAAVARVGAALVTSGAALVISCAALWAGVARADDVAEPEEAPPHIVRVAVSKQADAYLTEGRVRRLIALELPSTTKLADDPTGPLDENAVRLYIDLPEPTIVTIQAGAPQRKVETRRVDVAGLAWDVAARLTAVAASESVRSELEPVRRRPVKPRETTEDPLRSTFRTTPAISVSGGLEGAFLPGVAGLGGARLGVGFHQPYFSEDLSLAGLGGGGERGELRWIEGSIGIGYRHYFSSRVRSRFGAEFALARADLRPAGAASEGGFDVRAAARVSVELRAVDRVWVELSLAPGGVLTNAPRGLRGAWLGATLSVTFDALIAAPAR